MSCASINWSQSRERVQTRCCPSSLRVLRALRLPPQPALQQHYRNRRSSQLDMRQQPSVRRLQHCASKTGRNVQIHWRRCDRLQSPKAQQRADRGEFASAQGQIQPGAGNFAQISQRGWHPVDGGKGGGGDRHGLGFQNQSLAVAQDNSLPWKGM